MMTALTHSICDVPGIRVGHAQDEKARKGCTVVMTPAEGAVAGVDVRGSAPGTREVELLHPVRLIQKVHAVLLTGGSAFGLDAAGGVQQFLEQRNIGYDTGVARVPIVPTAVIYDLSVGNPKIRPDKKMGYQACVNAVSGHVAEGRVGVGTGATVGKILGHKYAMEGGVGTCSRQLGIGVIMGAIAVVNALGDVVDPVTGQIIAGARNPEGQGFLNASQYLLEISQISFPRISNTTLAVVATDAQLSKEEAVKVAQMAQDGIARAVRPAHTQHDGDIIFVLSVGEKKANLSLLGAAAAELVAEAIVRGAKIGNNQ